MHKPFVGVIKLLFSSLSFVFRFLPAVLIAYMLAPAKLKNTVLLIGSLIFYSLGEPLYVFLMILSILLNYLFARGVSGGRSLKSRFILFLMVLYNIGILLFFKYGAFLAKNISLAIGRELGFPQLSLPLGISFYTFQIMSYVIDVYRGEVEAEKNIIDLGAYLCMFPQLVAGPIVKYSAVRDVLKMTRERVKMPEFEEGLKIFTIGLGSKVLLANRFGQVWDTMSMIGYGNLSTQAAWIGVVCYTLQIYFDFNGYSLMAVGLGNMLGFNLPRNFRHPYTAGTVTDFWRRWHITLTDFFREYVYIPLGGNRGGALRTYRNMLIVWLITGFWHGADWNFVIWGLYYFVFLFVERLTIGKKGLFRGLIDRMPRVLGFFFGILGHGYTIFVVVVGWAIFAVTDLGDLYAYFTRLFAPAVGLPCSGIGLDSFTWFMYVWIAAGVLFSTPALVKLYEKYKRNVLTVFILLAIFWGSIVQLTDSVYNPFLYFRF